MRKTWFLFALVLSSCQKPVDFDIVKLSPEPVVNMLITNENKHIVNLSYTSHIKDDETNFINNAEIIFWENGILNDSIGYIGDGNYQVYNLNPIPGARYKTEISVQGYSSLYAEDIVPYSRIEIDSASFISNAGFYIEGDAKAETRIFFSDPANQRNFYEIKVLKNYGTINEPEFSSHAISSNDPVITSENTTDGFGQTLVFSDDLINGESYELSVFYLKQLYQEGVSQPDFSIYIIFRTVSQNYYHYKMKLEQHLDNTESDIIDGIASPVSMFSNIENGYGIFATYLADTLILEVKDED